MIDFSKEGEASSITTCNLLHREKRMIINYFRLSLIHKVSDRIIIIEIIYFLMYLINDRFFKTEDEVSSITM